MAAADWVRASGLAFTTIFDAGFSSNVVELPGNTSGHIFRNDVAVADMHVQAQYRRLNTVNVHGLLGARVQANGDGYWGGYYSAFNGNRARIIKRVSGVDQILVNNSLAGSLNTTHIGLMELRVVGNEIILKIEHPEIAGGQYVANFIDTVSPFTSGSSGLARFQVPQFSTGILFDNFRTRDSVLVP